MTIEAGKLWYEISIEQRGDTRNTYGESVASWSEYLATYADMIDLSGAELEIAQQINSNITTKIITRWDSGIRATMRILMDGEYYNIVSVDNVDERDKIMVLLCERIEVAGAAAPASSTTFFIFDIDTRNTSAGSSTSTQFALPLRSTGTYNFTVDWGDGNEDTITTWNDAAATHTYSTAGTYEIQLDGTVTGFRFANAGDKLKVTDITNWGDNLSLTESQAFYGCDNMVITATDDGPTITSTTFESMFRGCSSLTTIPGMENWNISTVTSLKECFRDSTSFNQSLANWDTSNVTDFFGCFSTCSAFNGDVTGWNVSSATTFRNLFFNCVAFNQDISAWAPTASMTSLRSTFRNCTLFNQNLNSWNVSGVTEFIETFYLATAFNGNITSWDTSSATSMDSMFRQASAFNQDISGFNTTLVTDMDQMLRQATTFDQDVGSWVVTALTTAINFLNGVTISVANLNSLYTGWEAQAVGNSVTLHCGSQSPTGAGITARNALETDHSWTITDGDG